METWTREVWGGAPIGADGKGEIGDSECRPLLGGAALWLWRGRQESSAVGGGFGVEEKPEGVFRGERLQPFPRACPGPPGRKDVLRREARKSSSCSSWGGGLCPGGAGPSSRAQLRGAVLPQVLTALDRDASCRKHKLRQKLEHIITLLSSNS
nr:uncharacterized protein LOC123282698 [Equus asinus]